MRTYNLAEAAALLGVSLATLRRWRAGAGAAGSRGAADGRRVWLTHADMVALARVHGRVLVKSAAPGEVADLLRHVDELSARVDELERWRTLAVVALDRLCQCVQALEADLPANDLS